MAQSFRFLLTDVVDIDHVGDVADFFEHVVFFFADEVLLEFDCVIKVVFNRSFAFAGYNDDVFDAGLNGFFDDVLDGGFVNNGQHFFRHRFCCRQKTCS